jgi:hypothetical protein
MKQKNNCPYLNDCEEARRQVCYSRLYEGCSFYEARNKKSEGLTKRLSEKLGNPRDKNSLQL